MESMLMNYMIKNCGLIVNFACSVLLHSAANQPSMAMKPGAVAPQAVVPAAPTPTANQVATKPTAVPSGAVAPQAVALQRNLWRRLVNSAKHPIEVLIAFEDKTEKNRFVLPKQTLFLHPDAKYLKIKHRHKEDTRCVVRVEEKSLLALPMAAVIAISSESKDVAEKPVTAPEIKQLPREAISVEAQINKNSDAIPKSVSK